MCPHRARRQEAGGSETEAMTHRGLRTQSIQSGRRELHADDWSLVDSETGGVLARIFDTGDNDLLGAWRCGVPRSTK